MASHMGHISLIFYSLTVCVCVRESVFVSQFQSKSPGVVEGMRCW